MEGQPLRDRISVLHKYIILDMPAIHRNAHPGPNSLSAATEQHPNISIGKAIHGIFLARQILHQDVFPVFLEQLSKVFPAINNVCVLRPLTFIRLHKYGVLFNGIQVIM